jgi:hypothetical protein
VARGSQEITAPIEGYSLLKAELSYAHMFSDTRSGHHAIMVGLAGGNLLNPAIGNDIFVQDGKGSAEWFASRFLQKCDCADQEVWNRSIFGQIHGQ